MSCPRSDRRIFAVRTFAAAVAEIVVSADGEHESVVGPVLEVVGGDQFVVEEVVAALVGKVMAADDVDAVVEHEGVRVGRVHMADDGLISFHDADGARERAEDREHRFQSFVGHSLTPCKLLAGPLSRIPGG